MEAEAVAPVRDAIPIMGRPIMGHPVMIRRPAGAIINPREEIAAQEAAHARRVYHELMGNPEKYAIFRRGCLTRRTLPSLIYWVIFDCERNPVEYLKRMEPNIRKSYSFFSESIRRNNREVLNFCIDNPEDFPKGNSWFEMFDNADTLRICLERIPREFTKKYPVIFRKSVEKDQNDIFDLIIEKYGEKKDFESVARGILCFCKISAHVAQTFLSKYIDIFEKITNWTINVKDKATFDLFRSYFMCKKVAFFNNNFSVEEIKDAFFDLDIKEFVRIHIRKFPLFILMSAYYPVIEKSEKLNFRHRKISLRDYIFNIDNFNKLLPYVLPDDEGFTIEIEPRKPFDEASVERRKKSPYSIEERDIIVEIFKKCCETPVEYNKETRLWTVVRPE